MTAKLYDVTVTAKYPAAGEGPGHIYVHANNAKAAISKARREMSHRGYDRHDGPSLYRAKVAS